MADDDKFVEERKQLTQKPRKEERQRPRKPNPEEDGFEMIGGWPKAGD